MNILGFIAAVLTALLVVDILTWTHWKKSYALRATGWLLILVFMVVMMPFAWAFGWSDDDFSEESDDGF